MWFECAFGLFFVLPLTLGFCWMAITSKGGNMRAVVVLPLGITLAVCLEYLVISSCVYDPSKQEMSIREQKKLNFGMAEIEATKFMDDQVFVAVGNLINIDGISELKVQYVKMKGDSNRCSFPVFVKEFKRGIKHGQEIKLQQVNNRGRVWKEINKRTFFTELGPFLLVK